jgi:predicted acetyltransferase
VHPFTWSDDVRIISQKRGRLDVQIEILEAGPVEYEIIRNMVPYYVYEMAGPMGWNCKSNGTFGGCDDLAEYWQKGHPRTPIEDRWSNPEWAGIPFLIKAGQKNAGFALIRRRSVQPVLHEVGEFFVLRKYQRQGVGRIVAHRLFSRFQGVWEVRQMDANLPAQAFWKRIVSEYTNGQFEDIYEETDGRRNTLQRFSSVTPSA